MWHDSSAQKAGPGSQLGSLLEKTFLFQCALYLLDSTGIPVLVTYSTEKL